MSSTLYATLNDQKIRAPEPRKFSNTAESTEVTIIAELARITHLTYVRIYGTVRKSVSP